VPLKVNEVVIGVLELASLQAFDAAEVSFLEQWGQNLAAALQTNRVNQRTQRLLAEVQGQAEAMRAQEEEMCQNQEELQSVQEEMSRQKAALETEVQQLRRQLAGNQN
jgi:nitric oxide reductase activation protein